MASKREKKGNFPSTTLPKSSYVFIMTELIPNRINLKVYTLSLRSFLSHFLKLKILTKLRGLILTSIYKASYMCFLVLYDSMEQG